MQISANLSQNLTDQVVDANDKVRVDLGVDIGGRDGVLPLSQLSLPPQVSFSEGAADILDDVHDWRYVSVSYTAATAVSDVIFTTDHCVLDYSLTEEQLESYSADYVGWNSKDGSLSFTAMADGDKEWANKGGVTVYIRFPVLNQDLDSVINNCLTVNVGSNVYQY